MKVIGKKLAVDFAKGRIGSLFGLAEGFSGVAVFVKACSDSPLITGEADRIAKELSSACLKDLVSFGEYLLTEYPEPPEERIISRRFNGGFDFKEGLSGFLWALRQYPDADSEKTEHLLEGFQTWKIENSRKTSRDVLQIICEESEALKEYRMEGMEYADMGRILKEIKARKDKTGFYKVFPERRHQYFLPAFLWGDTGIAYLMLCYAALA